MNEQPGSDELEVRETFKLASEFAPHITVTEETFFGHGWQPLTTSMLMSLWFLPADSSFDVPFLVDWYQRLGWKGANGKPLGAPVIRREIGLIREAGYISVTRLRGENGQAVGIQYSVSQRRSDQPESGAWIPVLPGTEGIRRSDHVQAMPTRGESPHVGIGHKPSSDHVQAMPTRGESPHVVDAANPQVAPRVANENGINTPPYPPEGGGTTPPIPHKKRGRPSKADKWLESCALKDGDYVPTTAEVQAANDFLQELPGKWQCGPDKARDLAPLLASRVKTQGYELDEYLELVLTQDNPKRPAYAPVSTLPTRIRDLKRFRPETAAQAASDGPSGLAPWCGTCNRGELPHSPAQRFRELPDGRDIPCPECHPKHARSNA